MKIFLNAGFVLGNVRTCGTKKKFATYQKSRNIARLMSRKHRVPLQAYPCPFCMQWHVGRKMTLDEAKTYDYRLPDEILKEWEKYRD